jgi:arginine utilization protein RocB
MAKKLNGKIINVKNFNTFVHDQVAKEILDEVLKELKISEEAKDTRSKKKRYSLQKILLKSRSIGISMRLSSKMQTLMKSRSSSIGTNINWIHIYHRIGSCRFVKKPNR